MSAITCFVSIIGIPFGIQHVKLAGCATGPAYIRPDVNVPAKFKERYSAA